MKKNELATKDHALMFGPYVPPPCRIGDPMDDAHYGRVVVGGFTTAPCSWPRPRRKGPPAPILTDELVRAIRHESAYAVAYWWGVSISQVQNWRSWLGVDRVTPGTARLLAGNAAGMSPESREAAASKRRGKPQPEHVRRRLLEAAMRPKSEAWAARAGAWMAEGRRRSRDARTSEPTRNLT